MKISIAPIDRVLSVLAWFRQLSMEFRNRLTEEPVFSGHARQADRCSARVYRDQGTDLFQRKSSKVEPLRLRIAMGVFPRLRARKTTRGSEKSYSAFLASAIQNCGLWSPSLSIGH